MLGREHKTANPVGNPKIRSVTPKRETPRDALTRSDFFHDLKKVVRKLPPDHPSRSGSQKR